MNSWLPESRDLVFTTSRHEWNAAFVPHSSIHYCPLYTRLSKDNWCSPMSDTSLQKICSQKTSCSIFNIENFVQDCEALLGCMVLTQSVVLEWPPFPQIDIIGAVVIVWRVRGKTIRSVLRNIVCNNCAQCDAHMNRLTVLWIGFCLTGPISLCLDSFLHVLCVLLYTVCMCRSVTRWGGPGVIEAYP